MGCTDENSRVIKVRAINSDTNMGKSNGYRIIYYSMKNNREIFLLTLYYKKDNNRVLTDSQIKKLVDEYVLDK